VSARKISSAGKPVEWVTPLGLHIVQPYHKPTVTGVCKQSDRYRSIVALVKIAGEDKPSSTYRHKD
jgi:hypothetical protein